jgi:hypothetical protein
MITDFRTPPILLNVQDMLDELALGNDTYFDSYNPDEYTINLNVPLDIPIFKGLVDLGGGGGLPVGEYQYQLRFSNAEGDRTNLGPMTPPIPVLQRVNSSSTQYPFTSTFGGPADITAPTSLGIQLRFRITNLSSFDFIEVIRFAYNVSAGVDVVPLGTIIAKLDIAPGEISIRDFVDPQESNEDLPLTDDDSVNDLSFIEKAKAIRYHDKKVVLMNYEKASKESNLTFGDINGKKIFPIVEALGKAGHNDPVQQAYKKNYMSGERVSFAVNLFDGLGGKGFAEDDTAFRNVQIPNRRVAADADSQLYSYGGMSQAADVDSNISDTFEVFDLENAISKDDKCTFKNIMNQGNKSSGNVNSEGCPDPGFGPFVDTTEIGYQPYRPTTPTDSTKGHNYNSVTRVDDGSSPKFDYDPKAFGPNYFSKGMAIAGVSNFPTWAKAFSVVRTPVAERVICQGIGAYSLKPGDFDLIGNSSTANKELDKMWFFSPDIEAGLVSQATISDINANPQNYQVQFISPLGFFSEMYNFENNTVQASRDRLVDMITYARILHDEGQINPNEDPQMGIGGFAKRFVAYNKYRNTGDPAGGGAFAVPDAGDRLFDMTSFSSITEGRGTYFEFQLTDQFYGQSFTGGTGNNDFGDAGMKDFTEPMYIVNIVQNGRDVIDQNIDQYYSTGHYQKIESIIGIGDGTAGQAFLLVDERWEDCIPDLSAAGPFAAEEFFVYLEDSSAIEQVFMDVTFLTPAQVNLILVDINTNGFYLAGTGAQVVGLYTHRNTDDIEFAIVFDVSSFVPSSDQTILVRYDDRKPLRVFGGDTTVGETIFSPIDREADANDDPDETQFVMNIGFPYRQWTMNPRQYIVTRTTGANKIQDSNEARLGYLRQLCIMFTCESRIATHFAHQTVYPEQYFPLMHYVMRPNRFDDGSFPDADEEVIADDNNMFDDYFDDYPSEYLNWKFGGLRFLQQTNVDYSVPGPIEFFSKPDFGFTEENKFCTGVAWSLSRAINQQDSPGLKTFLSGNRFDIDDDSGEIKKAWDSRTGGKGENLYAVCDSGICLLLTKKSILSNIDGDDLTVFASDQFIAAQYWLSRDVGSNDEMWRGMSEASVIMNTDKGGIKIETLFFPNKESVYKLSENIIADILDVEQYASKVSPVLLKIRDGYKDKVTGVYNSANKEYWLQINTFESTPEGKEEEVSRVFVYGQENGQWVGEFTYEFDQYLNVDGITYGMRGLQTFKLDVGFLIDGLPITAFLIQLMSKVEEQEWISFEGNTGKRGESKPSKVEFLDEDLVVQCSMSPSLQGSLYLKQYSGWWQFISRKDAIVSISRDRLQSRLLLYKIIHNFEEDFKIIHTVIQHKTLK